MKRITFGMLTVAVAVATIAAILGQQRTSRVQAKEADTVRQGPRLRRGQDCGVGRQIADLPLTDINGRTRKLSQISQEGVVVIAMTGTGCPLCKKYAPTLAAVEDEYRQRGVQFVFVNPNESEKPQRCAEAVKQHGFDGPYVRDTDNRICSAVQADTTTEVFVIDQSRTLLYRGAVDDQYGFAYANNTPTETFLKDALDAVLAGRRVGVTATTSPGCDLLYDAVAENADVTWHSHVSRILAANCLECHRSGGIAPMPFETYEQVKDYAGMITRVVSDGTMPPWFAADASEKSGEPWNEAVNLNESIHWANDRTLAEADKRDLQAWVSSGVPEGDPADAPLPRTFPDGWVIGQPDHVFEFEEPVRVKATGTMPYLNITVTNDLEKDRWVQAMEIRPSDPSVVHHVIVSVRGVPNESEGYWAAYVPGNSSVIYPPGMGKRLPKGATLKFQMHYTPNGKETFDNTKLAVIYCDEPPEHEVKVFPISERRKLKIPPNAARHEVTADVTIRSDKRILAFLPHMHLRGRAARFDLNRNRQQSTLLNVPSYDFNWQLRYAVAEPFDVQPGDVLTFTAMYDNSRGNPALSGLQRGFTHNDTIRWGEQTYEEMHLGYVEYVQPIVESQTPSGDSGFSRIDADGDGQITRDEAKAAYPGNRAASGRIFDRLDSNRDGSIDEDEFARLSRFLQR